MKTGSIPQGLSLLTLETKRATALYWLGVLLVSASVLIPNLLPCVDYPQHLALADVGRRLANPAAPEHAHYILNYFTYNALFHFLVAKLSVVLPIEVAGRAVVSGSLALLGAATIALVRSTSRPPFYAALFTPILFSFSVGWGFVNYTLATTVLAFTLVAIVRALTKPNAWNISAVLILGLLCAFAHVLAMLILCAMAVAFAPEIAWRATARGGDTHKAHAWRAFVRMFVALVPLLLGAAFCIRVYQVQYVWNPGMYRDQTLEGTAPPLWQKVLYFGAFASDLYIDGTDQILLFASIAIAVVATVQRVRAKRRGAAPFESSGEGPLFGPFIASVLMYLAMPTVMQGTHLIFERFGQIVVLGMVFAVPRFAPRFEKRAAKWALGLAITAGVNTILHTTAFGLETNDASLVIDELPEGRRATAIIFEPRTNSYRNGTLTHLAAYYGARKHGDWAYGFGRYLSVPVRFQPTGQVPWPRYGWEFDAGLYNPRCNYARAYDLVIVKAPWDIAGLPNGEEVLRDRLFGVDRGTPKLVSHHGEFWAFDTKGIPSDGSY